MGKLHTLRRAIEREPEKWIYREHDGRLTARGARRDRWQNHGQWFSVERWSYNGASYRGFVQSVLAKLGYSMSA